MDQPRPLSRPRPLDGVGQTEPARARLGDAVTALDRLQARGGPRLVEARHSLAALTP